MECRASPSLKIPLVSALFTIITGCSTPMPTPSVLLVSLDTTRADHWGAYGYDRGVTPRLDALAEQGLLFENAVTNSGNTLISHTSLFTGLFPLAHGVSPAETGVKLQDSYDTLAEDFAAGGFATAGFVTHGDWLTPAWGVDQGFDEFDSSYSNADSLLYRAQVWFDDRAAETPFFLFVHLFDVHSDGRGRPYQAPKPFAGRYTSNYGGELRWPDKRWSGGSDFLINVNNNRTQLAAEDVQFLVDQYDEGLAYADDRIGRFVGYVREQHPNTWVVIAADHGEAFMEHGYLLHWTIHEEIVRVPLIIVPPEGMTDMVGAPRRLAEQVQLVDIRPTLLSLAGLPPPRVKQGLDLMPWLRGDTADYVAPSAPLHFYSTQSYQGMRWNGHKLLQQSGQHELFDLNRDGEQQNLATQPDMADQVEQLRRRIEFHSSLDESVRRLHGTAEDGPALDPEALERLRSLGYLR